jgi:hypothetical protein
LAGRDLAPRLGQLGFHFVGQLKMIREIIINPFADFLARRYPLDFAFDVAYPISSILRSSF